MAHQEVMFYSPMQSLAASSLSFSYTPIGSPITNAASIVKIVNNSDVDVTVSTDAVNDMDFVPAGGFVLYDITTNHPISSSVYQQANTQFFLAGQAGTGEIYLVTLYIPTRTGTP